MKPTPDAKTEPTLFGEEEIEIARMGWLRAHQTTQVNLFVARLVILAVLILLIMTIFANVKMAVANGRMKPYIVRINDVGRAEVVRLDTDYVPQEPEIRDNIERLVDRMYVRNGFETPRAIELNTLYLTGDALKKWVQEAKDSLAQNGAGTGLQRVRILRCDIEDVSKASKEAGTIAHVRFATDTTSAIGAPLPGTAVGWEVTLNFRVGEYPNLPFDNDGRKKDQWLVRNPLGLRVYTYRLTRYIGDDVQDKNIDVIIRDVQNKLENEKTLEAATAPASASQPSK